MDPNRAVNTSGPQIDNTFLCSLGNDVDLLTELDLAKLTRVTQAPFIPSANRLCCMFWSTPTCPVEEEDKLWIEESMHWLLEEFGRETFREVTVVLPADEFFPDEYGGDEEDAEALVGRVCSYMKADRERLEVEFFEDNYGEFQRGLCFMEGSSERASGHYNKRRDKFLISLESSQLGDPMNLVATVAHELGHVRLLGEGRIHGGYEDHEPLTDLLTVFFGLGVFTANSAFRFTHWRDNSYEGWSAERKGYLTEEMLGYALALFALMRGERSPAWAQFLEGSVTTYFKSSLKYLEKTGKAARLRELVVQST